MSKELEARGAGMSKYNLFGVHIVPLESMPKDEALFVSGVKMTHAENLTTGEKKKIISFVDTIAAQFNSKGQDDIR